MSQGLTPQEREEILALLRGVFEETAAEALVKALDRVAARRAEMVTRQDIQGLQGLVAELAEGQRSLQAALERLAEAQARTEERIGRLEEAQVRTEERMGRLEEAITRLAEAQARTEERIGRLEEAQARTEERVGRLEEGQRSLQDAVTRLAEAQARTEEALQQTQNALQQLARQVGGLSETVGGDIEDIAYVVLHDVLKRELGWEVGVLERTWQRWNGEVEEINVFGQARDPKQPEQTIWIVGEAKHNLTLREVERFKDQVVRARQHLAGKVFPVCFCYRARPEVRERLKELGITLVFSYGRIM